MKKSIMSIFVMMLMIAVNASVLCMGTAAPVIHNEYSVLNLQNRQGYDFGDAPEGPSAIAYPSTATLGSFPTCISCGPSTWIQHSNFGAYFGPSFDLEPDGNAGLCPTGSFPPYDQDECFIDNDAGLIIPDPFTINLAGTVVPCPAGAGIPLGAPGQVAVWGVNVDIDVHNHMPSATIGYVNVLMDWNRNGRWGDPGEQVLVNFPVPNPFDGPLSLLQPPTFIIGQNPGYVWTRFSLTETPVNTNWIGDGQFEDGETEDYLLQISQSANNPPATPSTPMGPTTGVVGVSYTYMTSTTDPDGDTVRYGWENTGDSIIDFWSSYYPSGSPCSVNVVFNYPGTYFLRVLAEDVTGLQSAFSSSLMVTISSGQNNPPATPNTPTGPSSGTTATTYTYTTSTTDPDGDLVKYGWDWNGDGLVDLWDDNGGSYYASGASISTAHTFATAGTYQVQVMAEDNQGGQSGFSPFLVVVISANTAPSTPSVSGPSSGTVGTAYTFSATATDPESDQIYYWFDWGDGTNSGWLGPYMSGMTANTAHAWSSQSTFTVKVKAKDSPAGLESGWGSTAIRIPKQKPGLPLGMMMVFGSSVEVKLVQLEPGENYVDLEVMEKPFYVFASEMYSYNPGVFLRLYQAKGVFYPSLPMCMGFCTDIGIIG